MSDHSSFGRTLEWGWVAVALLVSTWSAAGVLAADEAAEAAGPNVLFISIDDLNLSLGCYGNDQVRTPSIDRLAERGVRFTRAYAQWPSCLPSRVSFLSGWSAPRNGVIDFSPKSRDGALASAVYLPQHFKQQGYFTGRLDKIFHIGKDDPASWTLTEEPSRDAKGNFTAIWTGIEIKSLGLQDKIIREGRYKNVGEGGFYQIMDCEEHELFDGRTAARAVELLDQRAADGKSFFLAVGFRRPHLPWLAPKKYFDLYPPDAIRLPPPQPGFEKLITDAEHREMIAHYYAATSYVDAQVGKVLAALERTGLAANTIVVLFGDQGYGLGEREGFFSKGNLWEQSLHVPLIVVMPGGRGPAVVIDRPVELLDMYPTLVELCGLPAPATPLDGRSFAPLLRDPAAEWRDHAMSWNYDKERKGLARTIRDADYRYTELPDGTPVELIDFRQDPHGWTNLVDDPAHAETRQRLRAAMDGRADAIAGH